MSEHWVPRPVRPAPDAPPETLDGYSDWRQIGRGGDAIVYRALQATLDREVAIKVLTLDDAESIRRFTREVQLMVSLGRQHPNIAKVLQIGTSSHGRPCIVMDYYEMGSLDQRLARTGPLGADEVIGVGTVIADALAFAHSRGVLHRDVKPQNILILPTSYVLADFGIARLIDAAHTASSDRFSYRHASPQVLDGMPPSGSDDIFSLGATMFHLLDGKPPFTTTDGQPDSALAYIKRVRIDEPRPLTRPDVPPALVALIQRCLQKDPTDRYASAAELRDALAAMRSGWLGVASAQSPAPPLITAPMDTPATHNWGGAPGMVHSTSDLTSMRLPVTDRRPEPVEQSPESSLTPAYPPPARPRLRLLSRTGITLAGIVLGIVAVVLWSVLRADPQQPGPGPIGPEPTMASPSQLMNPDLAPRNVQAEFVETNRVRITWERPIDAPQYYLIGIAPHQGAETVLVQQPLFDVTSAEVPVDPAWPQVCVAVIGFASNETGFEQVCIQR